MVREYEKNGASGLCIEDNKYPKRCSFYEGVKRELEIPEYHACKIRAACDNRLSQDFLIIARTESHIVGRPMNEVLERANVYADAGADAILIHHKGKSPDKIYEFSEKFKRLPLVCVPTTYNQVTEKNLIDHGFSCVIYANYGIRACVRAMQFVFSQIARQGTLSAANGSVVDMDEIFRLVCVEDLNRNEIKYSPKPK
jgi:phosphoenolpyruvate phosphomutase